MDNNMENEEALDINESTNPFVNADNLADMIMEEVEEDTPDSPNELASKIAGIVTSRYHEASTARQLHEQRWLKAFRNYRGEYDKDVRFRESEKSRVFVKVTKTKVLAAYGQLVDVVFSGNKFPLSIKETAVPEGIAEYAHVNLSPSPSPLTTPSPSIEGSLSAGPTEEAPQSPIDKLNVGFNGDGQVLKPGAVFGEDMFLGGLKKEFSDEEGNTPLEEGLPKQPGPTIKPAQIAALRMEKLIKDQIEESSGAVELRSAIFEQTLLGTGVIKGPFNYYKKLHKWNKDENGERVYSPTEVRVPKIEFVSIWDFYPDPNARSMEEVEWVVHRHRLNKSQVRALGNMPKFNMQQIEAAIKQGYNYSEEDFELSIRADDVNGTSINDRFEVLEYWGTMDREDVESTGIELPEEVGYLDEVQVNAWVIGNRLIRLIVNPFTPYRIPYLAFPYEVNPYSIFGVGVAENMDDSQMIMNGHARMAIDNLALAGNMVFDIDENALQPGENLEIFPGKVFKRISGVPGQAIYGIKFPSTAMENMQMFDKFRQLADESTGMPSYSHGQTGISGTTRTAAGMSMLMGAASINIKTVVKNIDDFLLKPLGESMFHWNMAFYEGDLEIEGDLEVRAEGTSSLVQKEVRSQRLLSFLQLTQNPAILPFVKLPTLIKEIAISMELDPEDLLNDPDTAAVYAKIIGKAAPAGVAPMPGLAPPGAERGNGQIAVGAPAMPGEDQFSGTPGGGDMNQLSQLLGQQELKYV